MLKLLANIRFIFLILLFTAIIKPVAAQEVVLPGTLLLTDKYNEHFLSPYLSEYKINDVNSIEEIVGQKTTKLYDSAAQSVIKINHGNKSTWLGLKSFNRSKKTEWTLDFGYSSDGRFGLANKISAYVLDLENFTIKSGTVNSNNGRIILELPANKKLQILINIDGPEATPLLLPIKIVKNDQAMELDAFIIVSILAAFLIGMAFFYGAISYVHNSLELLSLTAYYLTLCAILLVQNSFVVANFFFIGAGVLPVLYFIAALSAALAAQKFWDLNKRSALIKNIFYMFLSISAVIILAGALISFSNPLIEFLFSFAPTLVVFTIIPVISSFLSHQGQEENTPFMFGWLILLFGITITILPFIDMMPTVSSAINAYWFSIIPQAVFFMIATKMYISLNRVEIMETKTLQINETESVSKLRESREQIEQQRLLKVIEQERKVLGELRKGEARRTDEMRRAKEEADEANRAKSAFLAVVTHEIRTPMTGIMGMVKLLLDSNLSKDQTQYAQTIQDSSDAMLALLNDILDFEKIEQGKMSFEQISFDLPRLINGVVTLMNGHAVQKNIILNCKLGNQLPRFVKGDPTRLRQVLLNLTGNAIKFTDQGDVNVTAELINKEYEDDTALCEIYFSVADSGIGISEEAQNNLFNPFAQADSSISRKFGGTGLGLAISNGLVKAMGSEININSKEGEGSTFFFTVKMPIGHGDTIGDSTRQKSQALPKRKIKTIDKPKIIAAPVDENKEPTPLNQNLKILVVDDNFINQQVVKELLKKENLNVEKANSAEKALEILKQEKFDVVLMDIELPGMNGDEATKAIRRSNLPNYQNLRIIALTGNLMPDHIEQYHKAGMDDVLEKPIDPDKLFEAVLNINNTAKQQDHKPKTVEPTKPIGVLDTQTLSTLKGHLKNEDIKSMLLDVMKKNIEIIDQMRVEIKENNLDAVYARGHELKGMAGNFGLAELSQHAAIIEKKAKTGPAVMVDNEIQTLELKRKSAEEALNQWIKENLSD